jgi:hypothetical protein
MKTSSGALTNQKVALVSNLNNTISKLKELGYWIVGSDAEGTDYKSIDYTGKVKRKSINLCLPLIAALEKTNIEKTLTIITEIYTHIDRSRLRSEIIEHHPRNIKAREKKENI